MARFKVERSPHLPWILELRREGSSVREISRRLKEEKGESISHSALAAFFQYINIEVKGELASRLEIAQSVDKEWSALRECRDSASKAKAIFDYLVSGEVIRPENLVLAANYLGKQTKILEILLRAEGKLQAGNRIEQVTYDQRRITLATVGFLKAKHPELIREYRDYLEEMRHEPADSQSTQ